MHLLIRTAARASSLPKVPVFLALALAILCLGSSPVAAEQGYASWYGEPFHGRHMANGHIFDMYDPTTTACNIYPMGTWLRVTNPANGHVVAVQVRDRGGFSHALDLSYAAFAALADPAKMGITVNYEVVSGPDAVATPTAQLKPTPTTEPSKSTPASPPSKYTVTSGDSLSGIAAKYGLDVANLIRWNNITDANYLAIGQILVLSASPESNPTSRGSQSVTPSVTQKGTYTVVEGDTLWDIAEEYETTPEELARLNDLGDEDMIAIGQTLLLPGNSGSPISTSTGTSASTTDRYIVEAGDTLLGIALSHDTDVDTIMRLNNLDDSELIVIGQVLFLP